MSLKKWIPWQLLARKAAKAYGFANPIETLDRIRKFSRPSESNEPIELLRAGFAFHARGLANTKAIQNNLDWVWPYWIQRQYNPRDISFVPRAFSFSHVNLTQRNWTAVGVPDSDKYSIVDPRGLVTPFHDSWSLAFWIVRKDSHKVFPDQDDAVEQRVELENEGAIRTVAERDGLSLTTVVSMRRDENGLERLQIEVEARADELSDLAVSVRPYNPEGIQFVDTLSYDKATKVLTVNGNRRIELPAETDRVELGNYENGDVLHDLYEENPASKLSCEAGMGSASAVIKLNPTEAYRGTVSFTLPQPARSQPSRKAITWTERLEGTATVSLPDKKVQQQYELSKHTLALLSPDDIYPGPYTYKRFWFRDACLIAHALLKSGQFATCRRALERFPERQTRAGYFLSQEGEWDSNGQVLWIYDQYEKLTGDELPDSCFDTIRPAIKWIGKKLVKAPDSRHDGLFPAGFSAEHFGPNDHYYWDDLWAIGGLKSARDLLKRRGDEELAAIAGREADQLAKNVERSLNNLASKRARGALPASPYRRLDSGAIGTLVGDYPLRLWEAGDARVTKTADFLYERCVIDGAFFQDMIHSGLNIYLTLDLAQTFLRAGDPRWQPLFQRCLELATPTGQWPEAVHPLTLGGCMGDGQHAWAAAEWINLTLNLLAREEANTLIIGSGITEAWIQSGETIRIERAPTSFGFITASIDAADPNRLRGTVTFGGTTRGSPKISYQVPGYASVEGEAGRTTEIMPERQKPKTE